MSKSIQELMYKMDTKELKKYVAQIIGHKVNEIVTRVNAGGTMAIRFRHETYAYSIMEIVWENGTPKHYLKNFETGKLEEIK